MNRPRTAEEKKAASERSRDHWTRVRCAAKLLNLPTSAINKAWDLVSPYYEYLEDEQATREEVRQLVLDQYPDLKPPDLEGRIKIMMWAIRKCEGADKARDAFERACSALGEADNQ